MSKMGTTTYTGSVHLANMPMPSTMPRATHQARRANPWLFSRKYTPATTHSVTKVSV